MQISRRDALRGATAAAVVTGAAMAPLAIKAAGVKAALAGDPVLPAKAVRPDPLLAGVQALVNEIRRGLSEEVTAGEFWSLQEVAGRLEALPGIQPLRNESWDWRRQRNPEEIVRYRSTAWRAIRPAGEVRL